MRKDWAAIELEWIENKTINHSFTVTDNNDPAFAFTGQLDIAFKNSSGNIIAEMSSGGVSPEITYTGNTFNIYLAAGFAWRGKIIGELVETIGSDRYPRAEIVYDLRKEITPA